MNTCSCLQLKPRNRPSWYLLNYWCGIVGLLKIQVFFFCAVHIIWRFEQILNKLRQIIVKISVQHHWLLYLKLHTRNKTEPASTWDDTCYRCFEKWTPCQADPQRSGFQHANFKAVWVYCVFFPRFGRFFLFVRSTKVISCWVLFMVVNQMVATAIPFESQPLTFLLLRVFVNYLF